MCRTIMRGFPSTPFCALSWCHMPVIISLLRGVNIGGHKKIPMPQLRELFQSLGHKDTQTFINSGNVISRLDARSLPRAAAAAEEAIERTFGFHSDVIIRTVPEMRAIIARNPFAGRQGLDMAKLAVNFLRDAPSSHAWQKALSIEVNPEEMHRGERELYIYFPNGMGRSKFPGAAIAKALQDPGTARNWNTVTKLLAIAESLETGK